MVQGGVSAVRAVSASDSPISDGLTSGAAALALVCNLWFVDSASAAGHGDAPRGCLSAYISITNIKSSVICVLKSGSFCAPYRAETQLEVLAVPADQTSAQCDCAPWVAARAHALPAECRHLYPWANRVVVPRRGFRSRGGITWRRFPSSPVSRRACHRPLPQCRHRMAIWCVRRSCIGACAAQAVISKVGRSHSMPRLPMHLGQT